MKSPNKIQELRKKQWLDYKGDKRELEILQVEVKPVNTRKIRMNRAEAQVRKQTHTGSDFISIMQMTKVELAS